MRVPATAAAGIRSREAFIGSLIARRRLELYTHQTTRRRRLSPPHLSLSFPLFHAALPPAHQVSSTDCP